MEFGLVGDSYSNWCNVFLFVETDEGGAVKAVQGEAGEEVELRPWEARRHSNEDDTKVRLESLWFFTNSAYDSSYSTYNTKHTTCTDQLSLKQPDNNNTYPGRAPQFY